MVETVRQWLPLAILEDRLGFLGYLILLQLQEQEIGEACM